MRIISLVPSLTETCFALGCGQQEVVGRTTWCIHPVPQVSRIPKLGGTKTPNVRRIIAMAPDVVLMEEEENRRETFEALQDARIPVWTTRVLQVADVPPMLEDLGERLGRAEAGRRLAKEVTAALQEAEAAAGKARSRPRALPLIWHDPLMAVAPTRYGGDLVHRCGFDVPDPEPGKGYPVLSPKQIGALGTELLLLTSEPHDFTDEEGAALADAVAAAGFPRPRPFLVDGEALTWFGARTVLGMRWWTDFRQGLAR